MKKPLYALKALRAKNIIKNNLTQTEMGKILEISMQAYCDKENGRSAFNLKEIKTICEKFKVSPMDIFFDNQCTEMVNKEE